jgi:hypothetical protein
MNPAVRKFSERCFNLRINSSPTVTKKVTDELARKGRVRRSIEDLIEDRKLIGDFYL